MLTDEEKDLILMGRVLKRFADSLNWFDFLTEDQDGALLVLDGDVAVTNEEHAAIFVQCFTKEEDQ